MTETPRKLPDGTQIDQYRLEQKIGGGGFSIVYLATDLETRLPVVIKEFYPAKLALRQPGGRIVAREGKAGKMFNQARKLFFQEASVMASLHHDNIAGISRLIRANGTIYAVMDYAEGETLYQHIKAHGGRLDEDDILVMLYPVLRGLREMHARGVLHLDIKPGNIYLRSQGGACLIDFGAVQKMLTLVEGMTIPVISQGYSPMEQLTRNGHVGPWTDIYALGATLRSCLEGKAPPPVKQRLNQEDIEPVARLFKGRYSEALLCAIDWAMALKPQERPQSVEALEKILPPAPVAGQRKLG